MDATTTTRWLERIVTALETAIAGLLVLLLLVGVINFGLLVGGSVFTRRVFEFSHVLDILLRAIDIVLYLFIIVELYKTIIAYVQSESVVIAVIHAGMIAVVRQIITFKPAEVTDPVRLSAAYSVLLLTLLAGFFIVHRQVPDDQNDVD